MAERVVVDVVAVVGKCILRVESLGLGITGVGMGAVI